MRAALIISFLLSLYTNYLNADITIRYDSIYKNQKQPSHSVMLKQDLVRIDFKQGKNHDIMINLSNGDIIQLQSENKSFFKTNTNTINQYVSLYRQNKDLMNGLINQGIQHLTPQKRNQIQQMIQKYDRNSNSKNAINIQNTGKTDQILGVQCQIIAVIDQGLRVQDVCLADYQQLDLLAADIKNLDKLKTLIKQFKQSSPEQDLLSMLVTGIENMQGIPLKMVSYYANGKIKNMTQAAAISLRKIPAQVYQIPADFQQKHTPVL